ncbi:14443_t:CDS:2, partial [Entrophospora sp. SA101]
SQAQKKDLHHELDNKKRRYSERQDDDSSSFSTLPLSSFIKVDDLLDVLKKTYLPSCPLEPRELYDYLKKFYGDEDGNEAIGQTTCKEAQRKPESDNSFNNNNPRFVPLEISNKILGYGANGSIVYKGRFEGKDVAIKRLLLDYYKLAHHEVSLLQESDEHANIIRYYCTQQCESFLYIAIELCKAPELLLLPQQPPNNRITKAVDIFSAGCLFYYVISGGEHPFGDRFSREKNIMNGMHRLNGIEEEEKDLIKGMINLDQSKRPDSKKVMVHPYFWPASKCAEFLSAVSDKIDDERNPSSDLFKKLEKDGCAVFDADWCRRLDQDLIWHLKKKRTYQGNRFTDLMRAIRNMFIEFENEITTNTSVTFMNNFKLGGLMLRIRKAVIGGPLSEEDSKDKSKIVDTSENNNEEDSNTIEDTGTE